MLCRWTMNPENLAAVNSDDRRRHRCFLCCVGTPVRRAPDTCPRATQEKVQVPSSLFLTTQVGTRDGCDLVVAPRGSREQFGISMREERIQSKPIVGFDGGRAIRDS